jgi:hypothetical protein
VADAPLLSPGAARELLAESARRGQAPTHALDGALFVAGVGFADLDRATLDGLGEMFSQSLSTRSAADRGRIQAYMQYARAGEPLSPEAVAAGRALFAQSVRSLPAGSQARLTALFEKAVIAGIAHQQQAEERARQAALAPLPAVETPAATQADTSGRVAQAVSGGSRRPAGSAGGGGIALGVAVEGGRNADPVDRGSGASTGGSESYWRSRAASARTAVATAEKRVHDLEEQAARGGLVVPGPTSAACQAGVETSVGGVTTWKGGAVELRDAARNAKRCDSEILRQQAARDTQTQLDSAREALKRAQKALDDLEDEARRAGALPGWLR